MPCTLWPKLWCTASLGVSRRVTLSCHYLRNFGTSYQQRTHLQQRGAHALIQPGPQPQ